MVLSHEMVYATQIMVSMMLLLIAIGEPIKKGLYSFPLTIFVVIELISFLFLWSNSKTAVPHMEVQATVIHKSTINNVW